MSGDWTARFLLPSARRRRISPDTILAVPRQFGFALPATAQTVAAMSEDGTGFLLFTSNEAAWIHIREQGGLMSMVGDEGEVWLSVHPKNDVLKSELEVFGDVATFDEVRVGAASRETMQHGAAWRLLNHGLVDIGTQIQAQFAWGASDELVEQLIPFAVHACLRADEPLDARLPWCLAQDPSTIGLQMKALCRGGLGLCRQIGSLVEYRAHDDITADVRNDRSEPGREF